MFKKVTSKKKKNEVKNYFIFIPVKFDPVLDTI